MKESSVGPQVFDWSELRRLTRRRLAVSLMCVPSVVIAGGMSVWIFGTAVWAFPLVILLLIAYGTVTAKIYRFVCPRCKQGFFRTANYYNIWARYCVHCGLPRWASDGTTVTR
jgi:hypothetical protein